MNTQASADILTGVGVGLRHKHFRDFLDTNPKLPWLEVHSENFFKSGSSACLYLDDIRKNYPLSAHGVGLSLGSADGIDPRHIKQLQSFIERYRPSLVSEHLSWSAVGGAHINDLLPLPYTKESLRVIVDNIKHVQDALGRQILIENPSSYLAFNDSTLPEWEFFVSAAEQSDCGILLDINNIYVSATNHGFDAKKYIDAIPQKRVQEIHLAGYSDQTIEGQNILIDTHGARVYDTVWPLYDYALSRLGPVPTLIEWDTDIPELSVLIEEAEKAKTIMNRIHKAAA